jgi:hypothetical protein
MGRNLLARWLAAALLALPTASLVESAPNDAAAADCSFRHPQLPGVCRVTVAVARHSTPQHACDSVLRCINATVCAEAQSYCPNPGVPKIWKLSSATAAQPRADCAFSNGGYSGWCRLSVPVPKGATPQQACEAVVPCLNGAPCEGFVHHCQADIVSGWKVAEARPATVQAAPKH